MTKMNFQVPRGRDFFPRRSPRRSPFVTPGRRPPFGPTVCPSLQTFDAGGDLARTGGIVGIPGPTIWPGHHIPNGNDIPNGDDIPNGNAVELPILRN